MRPPLDASRRWHSASVVLDETGLGAEIRKAYEEFMWIVPHETYRQEVAVDDDPMATWLDGELDAVVDLGVSRADRKGPVDGAYAVAAFLLDRGGEIGKDKEEGVRFTGRGLRLAHDRHLELCRLLGEKPYSRPMQGVTRSREIGRAAVQFVALAFGGVEGDADGLQHWYDEIARIRSQVGLGEFRTERRT